MVVGACGQPSTPTTPIVHAAPADVAVPGAAGRRPQGSDATTQVVVADHAARPPQFPEDATFDEFRRAIEGYVAGVRPGMQVALQDAAGPYAAYLKRFHDRLHTAFALDFLERWPGAEPEDDPSLVTKVEIVLEQDGSLNRVGIVKTSRNLRYDLGVFNAVRRGAPYPVPPAAIRSPDGKVYLRWSLHRGESQCGPWNAEPYILGAQSVGPR